MSAVLRAARSTDAGATGAILKAFQDQAGWMPDLYTGAESIAFCAQMIDRGWTTVALVEGRVAGFMARDQDHIVALYLAQHAQGRGIGRQLLNHAKAETMRLHLLVAQANSGAIGFYLRQGFVHVGASNGANNAENLPDFTYSWSKESDPCPKAR